MLVMSKTQDLLQYTHPAGFAHLPSYRTLCPTFTAVKLSSVQTRAMHFVFAPLQLLTVYVHY